MIVRIANVSKGQVLNIWPPVSTNPLEAGPHERKLSHWGNAFEQSIGTQPLLSLSPSPLPCYDKHLCPHKVLPTMIPRAHQPANLDKMASFCLGERLSQGSMEKSNKEIFTQPQLSHGHAQRGTSHTLTCTYYVVLPYPRGPKQTWTRAMIQNESSLLYHS